MAHENNPTLKKVARERLNANFSGFSLPLDPILNQFPPSAVAYSNACPTPLHSNKEVSPQFPLEERKGIPIKGSQLCGCQDQCVTLAEIKHNIAAILSGKSYQIINVVDAFDFDLNLIAGNAESTPL